MALRLIFGTPRPSHLRRRRLPSSSVTFAQGTRQVPSARSTRARPWNYIRRSRRAPPDDPAHRPWRSVCANTINCWCRGSTDYPRFCSEEPFSLCSLDAQQGSHNTNLSSPHSSVKRSSYLPSGLRRIPLRWTVPLAMTILTAIESPAMGLTIAFDTAPKFFHIYYSIPDGNDLEHLPISSRGCPPSQLKSGSRGAPRPLASALHPIFAGPHCCSPTATTAANSPFGRPATSDKICAKISALVYALALWASLQLFIAARWRSRCCRPILFHLIRGVACSDEPRLGRHLPSVIIFHVEQVVEVGPPALPG